MPNPVLAGALDNVSAALLTLSSAQYGAALNQLTPVSDGVSFASALTSGNTLANQMLSCRVAGERGDGTAVIREGQCLWARASARRLDRDGASDGVSSKETATFYTTGVQFNLGGPWRLGTALGYENSRVDAANGATSKGDRVNFGGVIKYNPGPLLLAAGLTGGHGKFDTTRNAAFGGFTGTATSSNDQTFVSGRLTAAYLQGVGTSYLKPQIELAATRLNRDAYAETGTAGLALSVDANGAIVVSLSPSLEFGTEMRGADGSVIRPFARIGAIWLGDNRFSSMSSFVGAPAAGTFATLTHVDRIVADFAAGADIIRVGDASLRIEYDGQFGTTSTQHSGSAKVRLPF